MKYNADRNRLRPLTIELTAAQFAELNAWAKECRATPEELTVAYTIDALRMKNEGGSSFEEDVATTIYALSAFVDEKRSPEEAASK